MKLLQCKQINGYSNSSSVKKNIKLLQCKEKYKNINPPV